MFKQYVEKSHFYVILRVYARVLIAKKSKFPVVLFVPCAVHVFEKVILVHSHIPNIACANRLTNAVWSLNGGHSMNMWYYSVKTAFRSVHMCMYKQD